MASTTVRIPYARRRWPLVAIGLIVAAFVLLTFLSNFYVDLLWYREVQLSQVFWTRIWAQAGLASAFFVTFFETDTRRAVSFKRSPTFSSEASAGRNGWIFFTGTRVTSSRPPAST